MNIRMEIFKGEATKQVKKTYEIKAKYNESLSQSVS